MINKKALVIAVLKTLSIPGGIILAFIYPLSVLMILSIAGGIAMCISLFQLGKFFYKEEVDKQEKDLNDGCNGLR